MIAYGSAPADDVLEVTLFGPGLGEAIAVHLGGGQWLLVDSCERKRGAGPETACYLNCLGVPLSQVRAIVATHWHDDHVRAISSLVSQCNQADFFISGALRESEATAFLATYSGKGAPGQTTGTSELASILASGRKAKVANCQTYVIDTTIAGRNVKVSAFSPAPHSFAKSAAHFAKYLPVSGDPIRKAPPEPAPNLTAVVLHVDFDGDAVLLGADLEEDSKSGWEAMMSDRWTRERPFSSVYKVAHHGSYTGDSTHIWDSLLTKNPVACLTPFIQGRHQLPTPVDRERIKTQTNGSAYISSDASRKPAMTREIEKRLQDMTPNLKRIDTEMGAVRIRKRIGAKAWDVELLGAARKL